MLSIQGGKRSKKRGGGSLSPGNYNGAGTIAVGGDANFVTRQMGVAQVGGDGYGYANGGDAGTFGGSYIPVSRNYAGGIEPGRGGNNPLSGGSRRKRTKCSGGRKRSGSTRKSTRRRSTRRSRTRSGGRKTKKWPQIGCHKKGMKGGIVLVT